MLSKVIFSLFKQFLETEMTLNDRSKAVFFCGSFMFLSVLCLLGLCKRVFICALWSPAGKGLTSWVSFVVSYCDFFHFFIGILGQVWYLFISIPDLCTLTYLKPSHYCKRMHFQESELMFRSR